VPSAIVSEGGELVDIGVDGVPVCVSVPNVTDTVFVAVCAGGLPALEPRRVMLCLLERVRLGEEMPLGTPPKVGTKVSVENMVLLSMDKDRLDVVMKDCQ
jgi:hypothetical protein